MRNATTAGYVPGLNPPDRLLTDRELTARWQWARGTPAVLRSRGGLPIPFVRIGKRVRYRLADVLAYEHAQTVSPAMAK